MVGILESQKLNPCWQRMSLSEWRVAINFIMQSLINKELTIYGNSLQTRSFCFVDNLIKGLSTLMKSNFCQTINTSNNEEFKIIDLANLIENKINVDLKLNFTILTNNDHIRRGPTNEKARNELHWKTKISLNIWLEKKFNTLKIFIIK